MAVASIPIDARAVCQSGRQTTHKENSYEKATDTYPVITDNPITYRLWRRSRTTSYSPSDICLIRAREIPEYEQDGNFALDAILAYPPADDGERTWLKITREDGSLIEQGEAGSTLADEHLCPPSNDPTGSAVMLIRYTLEYDAANDLVRFNSYIEGTKIRQPGIDETDSVVFHRTDCSVEEADWDWYYEIEPIRDPR